MMPMSNGRLRWRVLAAQFNAPKRPETVAYGSAFGPSPPFASESVGLPAGAANPTGSEPDPSDVRFHTATPPTVFLHGRSCRTKCHVAECPHRSAPVCTTLTSTRVLPTVAARPWPANQAPRSPVPFRVRGGPGTRGGRSAAGIPATGGQPRTALVQPRVAVGELHRRPPARKRIGPAVRSSGARPTAHWRGSTCCWSTSPRRTGGCACGC